MLSASLNKKTHLLPSFLHAAHTHARRPRVVPTLTNRHFAHMREWRRAVVLNLGSIDPQGFVESVSGVRQRSRILIFIELWVFLCEIHVSLVLFFEHSDFVCN